jgi:hypothetical protein
LLIPLVFLFYLFYFSYRALEKKIYIDGHTCVLYTYLLKSPGATEEYSVLYPLSSLLIGNVYRNDPKLFLRKRRSLCRQSAVPFSPERIRMEMYR